MISTSDEKGRVKGVGGGGGWGGRGWGGGARGGGGGWGKPQCQRA